MPVLVVIAILSAAVAAVALWLLAARASVQRAKRMHDSAPPPASAEQATAAGTEDPLPELSWDFPCHAATRHGSGGR